MQRIVLQFTNVERKALFFAFLRSKSITWREEGPEVHVEVHDVGDAFFLGMDWENYAARVTNS